MSQNNGEFIVEFPAGRTFGTIEAYEPVSFDWVDNLEYEPYVGENDETPSATMASGNSDSSAQAPTTLEASSYTFGVESPSTAVEGLPLSPSSAVTPGSTSDEQAPSSDSADVEDVESFFEVAASTVAIPAQLELSISIETNDIDMFVEKLGSRVRHVSIEQVPKDRSALSNLKNFKKLRSLDISFTQLTDAQLEDICECSGLEVLDVSDTEITDDGAKFLSRLTNLKMLDVSSCNISTKGLQYFSELKNIEVLGLSLTKIDSDISALKGLSKLRSLNVSDTDLEDDSLITLAGLESLALLDIASTEITDVGLGHLSKAESLRFLSFGECEVSFAGLSKLPSGLQALKVLKLGGGISLKAIAHLTNLIALTIEECDFKKSELSTLSSLSKLEYLEFEDIPLKGIGRLPFRTLKSLSAIGCDVSVDFIHALSEFPELESLCFSKSNFSDLHASQLPKSLPISDLICSETQITDKSLVEFSKFGELSFLCVDKTRVTDEGISALSASPNLDVVFLQKTDVTPDGAEKLKSAIGGIVLYDSPNDDKLLKTAGELSEVDDREKRDPVAEIGASFAKFRVVFRILILLIIIFALIALMYK